MAAPEGIKPQPPLHFDPLQHLIPQSIHQSIARVITREGEVFDSHLVRWYPHGDSWDILETSDEALKLITEKERHFAMLHGLGGIAIPGHNDIVGLEPKRKQEITIYSFVENLDSAQPVTQPADLRRLYTGLNRYFGHVVEAEEPLILGNTFLAEQFCLTEGSTLTLRDIDTKLGAPTWDVQELIQEQLDNMRNMFA